MNTEIEKLNLEAIDDKIIAKAMCVYFPFNHMHTLEAAEYN